MKCPSCKSQNIQYDSVFDFHKCGSCGEVWSDGKNDPDYDDLPNAELFESISKSAQDLPESYDAWADLN